MIYNYFSHFIGGAIWLPHPVFTLTSKEKELDEILKTIFYKNFLQNPSSHKICIILRHFYKKGGRIVQFLWLDGFFTKFL